MRIKLLSTLVLFQVIPSLSFAGSPPDWPHTRSFCYQLQKIDLPAIGRSHFDVVVIDYSPDGSDARAFTRAQIDALRHSAGGPKRVLAYISIGEAEDYRFYWDSHWKEGGRAPGWLGPENPDWRGNYEVRYWDPAWQSIVKQYVDKLLAAGYDGIYMDIVDGYEFWGPGGDSHLNRPTAEAEMVAFVEDLARYARVTKQRPDFAVFAQGAPGLASHPDYVRTLTGIANEDNWFNGNRRNRSADVSQTLGDLDVFRRADRPVFVIDYVTRPPLIDEFYRRAMAKHYVPYASVRGLDKLTINGGHDPASAGEFEQPAGGAATRPGGTRAGPAAPLGGTADAVTVSWRR